MVDWRESSLQIVVAVIGSGLIVTALTSVFSYFTKPSLDIRVEPYFTSVLNKTMYRIVLVNNGYSTAKDVRLTMTYPNATVSSAALIYNNENFSLSRTPNSVVAFSHRLSTGVKIGIENRITGFYRGGEGKPLKDFDTDYKNDYYFHTDPFSITVTHNEGGNTYSPSSLSGAAKMYYDPEVLEFFIPIAVGILLIGIAYRYKKKSISKFASNVLKDLQTAKNLFKKQSEAIVPYKNYSEAIVPYKNYSEAIVPYKNYELRFDNQLQEFDSYEDYKLIDGFYMGLRERQSKILNPYTSNDKDLVKVENEKCLNNANKAYDKIDWNKFYKLDLILLIPSLVLASYFVSLIAEGLPIFLFSRYALLGDHLWTITIVIFTLRTIGTYYIMRTIFESVQGPFTKINPFPLLNRKIVFIIFCAVIMGIPSFWLPVKILDLAANLIDFSKPEQYTGFQLISQILLNYSTTIILVFDMIRISVLTIIVIYRLITAKPPENKDRKIIISS